MTHYSVGLVMVGGVVVPLLVVGVGNILALLGLVACWWGFVNSNGAVDAVLRFIIRGFVIIGDLQGEEAC